MRAILPHYREHAERIPEHFAPPGTWAKLEARFLAMAVPGAPVLVVMRHYQTSGCGGRNGYLLHTEMCLGVLPFEPPFVSAEEQDLIVGNLTIRTLRHVAWWGYDFHLKDEPIIISTVSIGFEDPEQPLHSPYARETHMQRLTEEHEGRKPDYPVEMAVGLVAIHAYVTEHGGSAEDFFLKAACMLGISEPLPSVLAQRDREIREGIVDELMRRTAKVAEIKVRVDEVFRRARSGSGVLSDEDGVHVVTMGDRARIRDFHDGIKRVLAQAIELRMHERPWVRELPTPGLTLDVPVFVRTLAEKLGVELPS